MELDIQFAKTFLWFVCGAFTYKILHTLIHLGQLTIVFEELNKKIILLAYHMNSDMEFVCKKKYEHLEQSGMAKKEIKFIREIDNRVLVSWQRGIIQKFFTAYPRKMHGILPFKDWNSAVQYALDSMNREDIQ